MTNGWPESAAAWIADLGDAGDYGRKHILDPSMLGRIRAKSFDVALDVGCGEGRFCRLMQRLGIRTVGIDPTESLVERARQLDPPGFYAVGRAEALEFPDAAFDLVVSYLTLIDIPKIEEAIPEMVRVLRPGGTLLIANLNGFNTAALGGGWSRDARGEERFAIDHYLTERVEWVSWGSGIRVQNWHRPLSRYMSLLLAEGLTLSHFAEPVPIDGDPRVAERYRRVPWFVVMEWQKPDRT